MPKIMLVEDDQTMVALLTTLLQMEGYQIVAPSVETLEHVMAVIQHEKPALVLVDIHLRQFNGFDLLHQIRGNIDLQDTRVVMSSGMDYTTECQREGADNFLLKPYMPDDLILMIRNTLNTVRN